MNKRSYYIDNLKLITIFCVFIIHCGQLFVLNGSFLESEKESFAAVLTLRFLNIWIMPMFFSLAGSSAYYSLKRRSNRVFIKDRARRLLLPYLFWVSLIYLPQILLWLFNQNLFTQLLPGGPTVNLNAIPRDSSLFEFFGYHLWFVVFLFTYSILSLPLLRHSSLSKKISRVFHSRGGKVGFPLLLLLLNTVLRPLFPNYGSWSDFIVWMVYFLLGYYVTQSGTVKHLEKQGVKNLTAGLILALPVIITGNGLYYSTVLTGEAAFIRGTLTLSCYFFILGAKGIASCSLQSRPLLKKGTEYLMPFYFIHQPWIIILGFLILRVKIHIFFQFWILFILSLIFIALTYNIFIKKFNPIRYVLGMNTIQKASVEEK